MAEVDLGSTQRGAVTQDEFVKAERPACKDHYLQYGCVFREQSSPKQGDGFRTCRTMRGKNHFFTTHGLECCARSQRQIQPKAVEQDEEK